MPIRFILLIAALVITTPSLAQSAYPECVYQASDPDGDGFGHENSTSCVITENSNPVGQPGNNECIDDNADGWGWDGEVSCQVPIPQTDCVDTDPIGDGWGWDGSTSCRVVPAQDKFSEIEEVEAHLEFHPGIRFGRSARSAAIFCGAVDGNPGSPFNQERTFYLFYDGSARTSDGYSGTWATGISLVDGTIRVSVSNFLPTTFAFTEDLQIDGDPIIRGARQFPKYCQWIDL